MHPTFSSLRHPFIHVSHAFSFSVLNIIKACFVFVLILSFFNFSIQRLQKKTKRTDKMSKSLVKEALHLCDDSLADFKSHNRPTKRLEKAHLKEKRKESYLKRGLASFLYSILDEQYWSLMYLFITTFKLPFSLFKRQANEKFRRAIYQQEQKEPPNWQPQVCESNLKTDNQLWYASVSTVEKADSKRTRQ